MPSNARLNNGQEVLAKLAKLYKYYRPATSPTTDVTDGAIAVDDAVIDPTTIATWTTGDDIIVVGTGGMDLLKLGTVPGSGTIPLVGRPAVLAQAAGAVMTKATVKDLGYIEDAGSTLSASSSKSPIGAANAGGPIAYIDADTAEITFAWAQRESSIRNIAQAFGVDEDSIRGAGTTNNPYRILISGDTIGLATNFCLRAEARKVDGTYQIFDILNAFPEVNVSANIVGKGSPTVWGCSVKCTHIVAWDRV
jgi:hypothetical protein